MNQPNPNPKTPEADLGSSVSKTVPGVRLRIASDLHLEFYQREPMAKLIGHFLPAHDADADSILMLAGDVSSSIDQLAEFLRTIAPRFRHTFYVPGNHEFYGSSYEQWARKAELRLREIDRLSVGIDRVHEEVRDGLRFLCCTLWGDGGDTEDDQAAIGNYLADFRVIRHEGERFTVKAMAALHAEEKRILAALLSTSTMPTVVMTHHLPSYALSHPRFGNECTGGFAGKCDEMLTSDRAPLLWVHGHTHDTSDRELHRSRIVCNPAGYAPEWRTAFNSYFAAPKFVAMELNGANPVRPKQDQQAVSQPGG